MTNEQFAIGFDGRTLSVPDHGGPARVGFQLLQELSKIEDNVITFGHQSLSKAIPTQLNPTGFYRNSRLYGLLWEQTYLPRQAHVTDVDVIYSPNSLLPVLWKGSKFVVTIHDLASLEGYSSRWYRMYEKIKLPIVARRADHIITVSNFSKNEIINNFNVPSSKISVVYNGVSQVFRNGTENESFELPEEYVLYVGDTSKRKNIDGTISAFKKFKNNSDQDYKLVLIGPTDSPTVDSLSIADAPDIINYGYVNDKKLKCAYEKASVFLFPSRYEGFGIPPLEAMSCGTPVIASNTSSLPEILGDAAMFADPDNHMKIAEHISEIVSNEKLSDELVHRGLEQAGQYEWNKSARKLRQILREVGLGA